MSFGNDYIEAKAKRVMMHDAVKRTWDRRPTNDWSKNPLLRLPIYNHIPTKLPDPRDPLTIEDTVTIGEFRHHQIDYYGITIHVVEATVGNADPEYKWVCATWTGGIREPSAYVIEEGPDAYRVRKAIRVMQGERS